MTKEKKLSDNIKKFLAQKEEEERRKKLEAQQKYEQLMANRTDREKNKIRKMLKVTKSANRSVLDDAANSSETSITMQGPEQPDEDDYGYVSQEASSIYQSLMSKLKATPEENKFSSTAGRPLGRGDLNSTKDRVKSAILREREDEKLGRRKPTTVSGGGSSSSASSSLRSPHTDSRSRKNLYDPKAEKEHEEERQRLEAEQKRRERMKKAAPPPMDFQHLLKLAEKKQHEPVQIEVPVKTKEPERLLTSKEKRELEEKRRRLDPNNKRKAEVPKEPEKGFVNGRIPKLNSTNPAPSSANRSMPNGKIVPSILKSSLMSKDRIAPGSSSTNTSIKLHSHQAAHSTKSTIRPIESKPSNSLSSSSMKSAQSTGKMSAPLLVNRSTANLKDLKPKQSSQKEVIKTRELAPKDLHRAREMHSKEVVKPREFPPKDVGRTRDVINTPKDVAKPREFPPRDIMRAREFPPRDVMRAREFPPRDIQRNGLKRKMPPPSSAMKRRIIGDDDEDESEYDSELDDFIDDDDVEEDYSRHIKEIFGYDKSRYRDDYDDVDNMESTFAQQQREEFISKKIGMMEDLEDMKQEAEEKARKMKRRK